MRLPVLFSLIIIPFLKVSGQEAFSFIQCASDEVHKEWLAKDEHNSLSEENEEKEYVSFLSHPSLRERSDDYTLPIVIHIIHANGSEDIPDSQIQDALTQLNEAFRNQGYYNPQTGVDTRISFCLAKRDPNNQPTSGITRTYSTLTELEYATEDLAIKNLLRWNPRNYINVWVVRNVCFNSDCRVVGYSTFPQSHGGPLDGIVIESSYFGKSPSLTTSFIHEMGHYLGLAHTFLGGCKNDNCLTDGDRVCDTPPDNITGYFPCELNYNSCMTDEDDLSSFNPFRSISLGGLGDQSDMFQNYMDYGTAECFDRFTFGQAERMSFFINNQRNSLLKSMACLQPCSNSILASFSSSSVNVNVGDIISLTNTSINAIEYQWFVNSILYSTAQDTTIKFDFAGMFTIMLVANSQSVECLPDTFSIQVNVVCPTTSQFTYSLVDNVIYLKNTSLNEETIEWKISSINELNLFSSSQSLDTFHFDSSGYYEICLNAIGETCIDSTCKYVRIYTSDIEQCSNGIDDDGDGLVDLFDNDCICDSSSYQAQCQVDCENLPDTFPKIKLRLKWESDQICNYISYPGNLVCGDLDADGNIEIVSCTLFGMEIPTLPFSSAINGITILSGQDGSTEKSFNFTPNGVRGDFTNVAISKGIFDANADIYFLDFILSRLVRYDLLGNKKWESSIINLSYLAELNFADFNGDGISEVYMNSMIFNSETGKLLALGKSGIGGNKPTFGVDSYTHAHTVAGDLLPTPGLELAAGNTVYNVQINNLLDSTGNFMIPIIADFPIKDGLTAIADIDGDQQLDVIAVRSNSWADGGGIWIWNPRTRSIIASGIAGNAGGNPAVADLDGDCIPEIIVAFRAQLIVYSYTGGLNLEIKYIIPTTDLSGFTSVSLFDFNQDGNLEIVYRDETDLLIIEGSTGNVLDSYPVYSGTGMEGPIIADIDNDGAAEIVVNGSLVGLNEMKVFAFESDNLPWAPARSIWNQIGYHVTNVNDDLTIPKEEQNIGNLIPGTNNCILETCPAPYNVFMTQATYRTQEGCVQFPSVDMEMEVLTYDCHQDSFSICFVILNNGAKGLIDEPVEVTFWSQNPKLFNSNSLITTLVTLTLEPNQTDTFCFTASNISWQDSFYIVVNDPGTIPAPYLFPLTNLFECNYSNNIDSFFLDLTAPTLDLGPDIEKCASDVLTFNAGEGFAQYLWDDFSTDSIYSTSISGFHYVEALDYCGRAYRDTVFISIDSTNDIDLGGDISVCSEEIISFTFAGNYDWIKWIPSVFVDCDTCLSINVMADTSFSLIAVAGTQSCVSTDTVEIQVKQPIIIESLVEICEGESLRYRDSLLYEEGLYIFYVNQCDSIFNLNLAVLEKDTITLAQAICTGDSIQFGGNWIKSEGVFTATYSNIDGCDSTVYLELEQIDEIIRQESISICEGDSVQVFGQWVSTNDTLSKVFQSQIGCDSVHIVEVLVSSFLHQNDTLNICEGDSIYVNNNWIKNQGIYIDTILATPCNTIITTLVELKQRSYSYSTIHLCPGNSVWLDNRWISQPEEIQFILTNVFGCDSIQNISISIPEKPSAPEIEIDCEHSEIYASIQAGVIWEIVWDNGDTDQNTIYSFVDSAKVTLYTDPDCQIEYRLVLPMLPNISLLPNFEDLVLTEQEPVTINLELDPKDWNVEWSPPEIFSCPNCFLTEIHPNQNTVVEITLIHSSGCIYHDSFNVLINSDTDLYIPNTFSPNGDGVNDYWELIPTNPLIRFESIEIFDRWGDQVASWKDVQRVEWNGKFRGKPLESGVFAYRIRFSKNYMQTEIKFGNITLLR